MFGLNLFIACGWCCSTFEHFNILSIKKLFPHLMNAPINFIAQYCNASNAFWILGKNYILRNKVEEYECRNKYKCFYSACWELSTAQWLHYIHSSCSNARYNSKISVVFMTSMKGFSSAIVVLSVYVCLHALNCLSYFF